MVALIFKGLLFYFTWVFIKNVFFGYKTYQKVKDGMKQDNGPGPHKRSVPKEDILEAEYRVIKD
jgi:hypothetical protein